MEDLEAIRSDVPNLMRDVPNFVKDVPRVPNCVLRWGLTLNYFLVGSKMRSWTIHVQMGDSEVIGSNVPNLIKHVPNFANDVPNFVKDVPNFVKDVPMLPKSIMRWETTFNNFLRVSKGRNGLWKWR